MSKTKKNDVGTTTQRRETPRIQKWYDVDYDPGEVNDLASETVPDMSLSVPQIMHRFASGRTFPSNGLEYTDDLPDLRNMDIEQRRVEYEALRERTKQLQKEVDEKRQLATEQIRKKQQRIDKLLDEQQDNMKNKSNTKDKSDAKQSDNIL